MRVGINPGVPAHPARDGLAGPDRSHPFGASNMLSFSPLGTATPGTFYLAGETRQAAVRVTRRQRARAADGLPRQDWTSR